MVKVKAIRIINDKSVTEEYLAEIKKNRPIALKKLKKLGFNVKEVKGNFEIISGDMSKLYKHYISAEITNGKVIIPQSEFEEIAKLNI